MNPRTPNSSSGSRGNRQAGNQESGRVGERPDISNPIVAIGCSSPPLRVAGKGNPARQGSVLPVVAEMRRRRTEAVNLTRSRWRIKVLAC